MPNVLDGLGLETATRAELVEYFTAKYQLIYGADVNLASNTPDGQMMNIFIQSILDVQDLVVQVYNSYDPDNAIGNVLDQRVTVNGIQRQAGTYTITDIELVNTESVNLYGLDGSSDPTLEPPARIDGNEIYTVSDNAGNRWYLEETETGLSAGTHTLSFRAATPGANLTTPNTITTMVTVVLGVDSVNNPDAYTTLGENEETDAALRLRRQRSVSLASQGYQAGLLAALENITGITSAFVYENDTGTTDDDDVPGHSIWVIVAGSAEDADIAQAIFTKRNAGAGMKGDTTYVVTGEDGLPFLVRWDEVQVRNLFIKFTVASIDGVIPVAVQLIREGLPAALIPGVNETINVNQIATAVQAIDANALVTSVGLSLGDEQTMTLSGVAASGTFVVNYAGDTSAAINWNDAIGTIQTKVQAIDGLSEALVTGSIASQSLVFDLSNVGDIEALLFVTANSLQTGGAVAITFAYDADYSNTLAPPSKRNQLVVTEDNIVIIPLSLLPVTSSVAVTETVQFTAAGGYGTLVFSLFDDNSGATIDDETGLYTAGATPSVTDTIRVTDSLGNFTDATVGVTT